MESECSRVGLNWKTVERRSEQKSEAPHAVYAVWSDTVSTTISFKV